MTMEGIFRLNFIFYLDIPLTQLFSKAEIFDCKLFSFCLKTIEIQRKDCVKTHFWKSQNQISQLWKIIGSKNLEVFLGTIEGISWPNIKNHLIIPLKVWL